MLTGVKDRFDQPDFMVYKDLQIVFLKSVNGQSCEQEMSTVKDMYSDDINTFLVRTQIRLLPGIAVSHV